MNISMFLEQVDLFLKYIEDTYFEGRLGIESMDFLKKGLETGDKNEEESSDSLRRRRLKVYQSS